MGKYARVAATLYKAQMVYRFDVAMTALEIVGKLVAAWVLWGALFATRETIAGFDFRRMFSYYVFASFLAALDNSNGVKRELFDRIRDGSFTKFMVIPARPELHFLAQSLGASAYYALYSVAVTAACALAFPVPLSVSRDPAAWLLALAMLPLGLAFMCFFRFLVGIVTLKSGDAVSMLIHMEGNLVALATGAIVPLALLPAPLLGALRWLPFTYVAYTPAMLLSGQATAGDGLLGLGVLAAWAAAAWAACRAVYARLRKNYDGAGV